MATYKVIQDIEAEDKLFGPLSLKQFIFAGTAGLMAFFAFMVATRISPFAAIPLIPFILVPGILAAPLGRDQPTEVWLAAQIRFFLKPRRRVWDQSGLKELVTITVPKKLEHVYTDGLTQQQVRSRLNALANTVDSRGWVVKHSALNMAMEPTYDAPASDRLIDPVSLPQNVPDFNITNADDILDATANPTAQHFEELVQASSQNQKNAAIARMQQARTSAPQAQPPVDYSFIDSPAPVVAAGQTVFAADLVVSPGQPTQQDNTFVANTADENDAEKALLSKIHEEKEAEKHLRNPHHKTIKTPEELAQEAAEKKKAEFAKAQAVTPPPNPVNIELAKNAPDLKISTIAGIAKKKVSATEGEIRIQH